jgi:hypothetical protein
MTNDGFWRLRLAAPGASGVSLFLVTRVLKIKAFRAKWVVIGTKTKNPRYWHNRST